jgi:hypothetical protein
MTNEEYLKEWTHAEYLKKRGARDLEMMRHPERWPCGNQLPLKRYNEEKRMHDFSILVKPARDFYHWVPETGPAFSRLGGDELLVELINSGWLVD